MSPPAAALSTQADSARIASQVGRSELALGVGHSVPLISSDGATCGAYSNEGMQLEVRL